MRSVTLQKRSIGNSAQFIYNATKYERRETDCRLISKFDKRSRSRRSRCWPKEVMSHISRCVLMKRTHWEHFHVSISLQSKVISKKNDLRWSFASDWPLTTVHKVSGQNDTQVITISLKYQHSERIWSFNCVPLKRRTFDIFPIYLLVMERSQIDLSSGYRYKKSEIYEL